MKKQNENSKELKGLLGAHILTFSLVNHQEVSNVKSIEMNNINNKNCCIKEC